MRRSIFQPIRSIVACLLVLPIVSTMAQDDGPLRVGVVINDPLAFERGDDFDGIAIELWREILAAEGKSSEFIAVERGEATAAIADQKLDAVLGVRPTVDEVGQVRYTQPFVTSGLAIATVAQHVSMLDYAKAFFTARLAWATLSVSVVLLFVGIACWLAERRHNTNHFRKSPRQGIWDGFYWAGVTMTTIGYGDKVPMTNLGKIVALLWMLAAIGVSSVLTASVVSIVDTVRKGSAVEELPGDLRDKKVGVVAGSAAETFLTDHRIETVSFDDLAAALENLASGDVDAVADTEISLNTQSDGKTLTITPTHLRPQGFTIAVGIDDDELFEKLERGILEQTSQPDWHSRIQRYTKSP